MTKSSGIDSSKGSEHQQQRPGENTGAKDQVEQDEPDIWEQMRLEWINDKAEAAAATEAIAVAKAKQQSPVEQGDDSGSSKDKHPSTQQQSRSYEPQQGGLQGHQTQ